MPLTEQWSPEEGHRADISDEKKKEPWRLNRKTKIAVGVTCAIIVVVCATIVGVALSGPSPSASSSAANEDLSGDDNQDSYQNLKILYSVPIFAAPNGDNIEIDETVNPTFILYEQESNSEETENDSGGGTISSPSPTKKYMMKLDNFVAQRNADDNNEEEELDIRVYFSNNLPMSTQQIIAGEEIFLKEGSQEGWKLSEYIHTYSYSSESSESENIIEIGGADGSFQPELFGGILLVYHHPSDKNHRTTFGNALYEREYQHSIYPTYRTVLDDTTEEYYITGNIIVQGSVRRMRMNGVPSIIDEPIINFEDITIEPMPPKLWLYLTKRGNYMRFNEDEDVFVAIEEESQDPGVPGGSFAVLGSFSQDWKSDPMVDVRDYKDGNWFLWCETFTITLAGGPLDIIS